MGLFDSETTTKQKNTPPGYRNLINNTGHALQQYLKQNPTAPVYQGTGVTPFSSQTLQGMKATQQLAKDNPLMDSTLAGLQGITAGNGLAQGSKGALQALNDIMKGNSQITTGAGYQQIGEQAQDPYASQQYLTGVAAGNDLNGSPQLDALIANRNEQVGNSVKAAAAAGGALRGSDFISNLSREQARATDELSYNDLTNQYNRQLQAVNMLDNAKNSGITNQLSALAGLTGVQGTNIANQAGAAQSKLGALQQGQANKLAVGGLLPSINNARYQDADRLLGVGALQENKAGEYTQSDINKFYESQNAQLRQIQNVLGIAGGAAPFNSTTTTAPGVNPLSSALGTGILGSVLGSRLGGNTGALLGGAGGALAGFL